MAIRILIADRHDMFCEVLRPLLQSQPDFTIVGETTDGSQVMKMVAELKPDVLLMDLNLRKRTAMDILQDLAAQAIKISPILLTDQIEKNEALEALQCGAQGIVLKQEPSQLLFKCIRTVFSGEYWISRNCVGDLVHRLQSLSAKFIRNTAERAHDLTQQQQQIVDSILAGCSNKEIAEELSIGERTVKYHLTHIFEKLGVSDRRQLAQLTIQKNLVDSQS
jgi:DNA-binding NarL/FixJ family response regulator